MTKKRLDMKSKNLSKTKFIYQYLIEKFMELIYSIPYLFRKRETWVSNLIECYSIYDKYVNEEYVKEFLDCRRKILSNNRYKMTVKTLYDNAPEGVVGKVTLYRKQKYIHEAILKKKNDDSNLIYWSFDNKIKNK